MTREVHRNHVTRANEVIPKITPAKEPSSMLAKLISAVTEAAVESACQFRHTTVKSQLILKRLPLALWMQPMCARGTFKLEQFPLGT